jgi:hypothetical protein
MNPEPDRIIRQPNKFAMPSLQTQRKSHIYYEAIRIITFNSKLSQTTDHWLVLFLCNWLV